MRKIIIAAMLCTAVLRGQTVSQSVTYNETTVAITNPERGLFMELETKYPSYSGYKPLSVSLTENNNERLNYLTGHNISLIRFIVRLDDFVGKDVLTGTPYNLLTKLTTDMQTLRANHLKCVIRFCYSSLDNPELFPNNTYEPDRDRMLGNPRNGSNPLKPGHINQLATVTTQYEDVISSVEAGFIGNWGEWYYSKASSEYGVGEPSTLTTPQLAARAEVATQMMNLAPNRMLAFRTVYFQKMLCPNLNVGKTYPKYNGSIFSRVAAYDDAFVSDDLDFGTFLDNGDGGAGDRSYLASKSKTTFTGGESAAFDATFGSCTNAQQKLADYNFNYLNYEENSNVIANWQTQGCFPTIANKLGYRLILKDANVNATTHRLTVHLRNEGYGHPINPRPVFLVLRNAAGIDYRVWIAGPTDTDPSSPPAVVTTTEFRSWYVNSASPTSRITLSKDFDNMTTVTGGSIPAGNYNLFLELPDGCASCPNNADPYYSVRFANDNGYNDSSGAHPGTFWNVTNTGTIAGLNNLFMNVWVNSSGTMTRHAAAGNDASIFEANAYPNPFGESFTLDINTSATETVQINVFDLLGKLLETKDAAAGKLNGLQIGSQLPAGIYLVSVKQGDAEKKIRMVKK